MSVSRVTWASFVPILVFLGLSVLDLGPMYEIDRQTDRCQTVRQKHSLMPRLLGGIMSRLNISLKSVKVYMACRLWLPSCQPVGPINMYYMQVQ